MSATRTITQNKDHERRIPKRPKLNFVQPQRLDQETALTNSPTVCNQVSLTTASPFLQDKTVVSANRDFDPVIFGIRHRNSNQEYQQFIKNKIIKGKGREHQEESVGKPNFTPNESSRFRAPSLSEYQTLGDDQLISKRNK